MSRAMPTVSTKRLIATTRMMLVLPSPLTACSLSPKSPAAAFVATVGTDSTVMPSTAEAASAVASLEESEVCTAVAVVEAGTAMLAVIITLAAATLIVTNDLSTPAAAATLCCKLEVSE
eukprot:scaffold12455_cov62-Phaeocystis_antarctica.AAC.3